MSEKQALSVEQRNKRTVKKLSIWAVAMFGFAFAMVPIYEVVCEVTGLNGKTSDVAADGPSEIDADRVVSIEFATHRARGIGGDFYSATRRVHVNPGEITLVNFYASNNGGNEIITQSIPSVSPGEAARYLHKTQCFCFDHQAILAGERKEMPMIFYLDPALPRHVSQMTLTYTIYDITERVAGSANTVVAN